MINWWEKRGKFPIERFDALRKTREQVGRDDDVHDMIDDNHTRGI